MVQLKIMVVACEDSGDILGSALIRDLKDERLGSFIGEQFFDKYSDNLAVDAEDELGDIPLKHRDVDFSFAGMGGTRMEAAGLEKIAGYEDIAVIGLFETLAVLRRAYQLLDKMVLFAQDYLPDVVVTIDSPGFNFQLVKRLRKLLGGGQTKYIHYVAPSVWARRPARAQEVARLFDHIMLILPFEVRYFTHMSADYVGHVLLAAADGVAGESDNSELETAAGTGRQAIITVMPGSRINELRRHLPVIQAAMRTLEQQHSGDIFYIFLAGRRVESFLRRQLGAGKNFAIVSSEIEKKKALSLSDLAWVKSGTSTLEVAMAMVPMITFYRLSPLTELVISRQLKIKQFNLVNLVNSLSDQGLGEEPSVVKGAAAVTALPGNSPLTAENCLAAVPELIGWQNFTVENLIRLTSEILGLNNQDDQENNNIERQVENTNARPAQQLQSIYQKALNRMKPPSEMAAAKSLIRQLFAWDIL